MQDCFVFVPAGLENIRANKGAKAVKNQKTILQQREATTTIQTSNPVSFVNPHQQYSHEAQSVLVCPLRLSLLLGFSCLLLTLTSRFWTICHPQLPIWLDLNLFCTR